MIVIQQVGGQVGLVVDEVFGQKHFTKKQAHKIKNKETNNEDPLKYVEVTYKEDDIIWNIFDDELLINDPSFKNAAAI